MAWVALIAVGIAAVDQFTKWLVNRSINPQDTRVVISGFFSLVNWRNTGAAWGIFQHYNLLLTAVSVLTVLALWLFRHSLSLHRSGPRLALGLIVGGISGNLIDRIRLGFVVDFLNFSVGPYHWPAFNVADSAICVGLGLYVILSWRADDRAENHPAPISS
ncbi:MAG TPA: signal peptidase II [Verrucomicrobiae bacterium]|nr:signal peptidase II [Verrucomicrobiae bacterium]